MKKLKQGQKVKIINEKSQFFGQLAIVNEIYKNRQFVSVIGEYSDTRALMKLSDLEPVKISNQSITKLLTKIFDRGYIIFNYIDQGDIYASL